MKNFVQPGNTITLTAPYAVTSGDGLLVGAIFGVAAGTAAIGEAVDEHEVQHLVGPAARLLRHGRTDGHEAGRAQHSSPGQRPAHSLHLRQPTDHRDPPFPFIPSSLRSRQTALPQPLQPPRTLVA